VPLPAELARLAPNGVTWSGHTIIAALGQRALQVIPDDGSASRTIRVTRNGRPCSCMGRAVLTPDGTHLVLANPNVFLAPVEGGEATDLGVPAEAIVGMHDGLLVYTTGDGTLMAAELDVGRRVLGRPVAVDARVTRGSAPAIARNGTLAMYTGTPDARLELVDEQGRGTPLGDSAGIPANVLFPRFSPDGRRIAMAVRERAAGQNEAIRATVSIVDLASRTTTRLTTDIPADRPEWSPDGRRVLFRRLVATGGDELWWQPYDRSSPAEPLQRLGSQLRFVSEGMISTDGQWLLYRTVSDQTGRDIWYRALRGDTTPRPFETSPADEMMPRFSPDGRWVAFTSDESGTSEVFVRPFPGPGGRMQVSAGGGTEPVWAPDGRRLFYISGTDFMAASLATEGGLRVTARERLFRADFTPGSIHANYDVAKDGRHFLMARSSGGGMDLTVVLHWLDEARRQLAR
jgi:Tol biopolymer transport system component